jgi:hypothetical protein
MWMIEEIFSTSLTEIGKTMAKEKKMILLFDNCSAHRVDVWVEKVKLYFLPANFLWTMALCKMQRSTLGSVWCN